ncbi:MAG: phosphoribosylformylglycinamidine synthase [Clostridia bacterium]|nr:phosphoribosylformylglycinamidine synthase [Clostridia bacterium]
MSQSVKCIYVEKRPEFAVEAGSVFSGLKEDLGIKSLKSVRVLNRYCAEGIDDETFELARGSIFSEPQVDDTYDELPEIAGSHSVVAVEYLPGQYDQRADSCMQCIQLLTQGERPIITSAKVYVLMGRISKKDLSRIKDYLINPVESREALLKVPDTLVMKYDIPEKVAKIDGFCDANDDELFSLIDKYGLAMDKDDIAFCREYFRDTEHRDPTMTELRMIDTYWSDHCRHTTFLTKIEDVSIDDDYLKDVYEKYLKHRQSLYIGKHKDISLMDIATIAAKVLKKAGKLKNLDESEEINACTIKITVDVGRERQKWLLLFKNETHNHPTEIEPFGGAATCLGGAIRDPLSGRSYVYQAMRVTGAADPRVSLSETMEGKLPQRKIVRTAANGYSSYGNQIGLATGLVSEVYHPDYVAKRLEIGAVVGAAPQDNVRREKPECGDVVILLGGRTGRDGCGGATGSSKSHTLESLEECGAEVQKGNPPEERKLQRLFRNPEASRLIKRCNDFGAGGVSVAIGELADSLEIDLNRVPKKYEGLDGTELAISESQERMAVVVEKGDADRFMALAAEENLEATVVARVTDTGRLVMKWNGDVTVDLSREFLNSNGAPKTTRVSVPKIDLDKIELSYKAEGKQFRDKLTNMLSDLNVCSQRGLVERFDSTIGAGSVVMPYGGIFQRSKMRYMAAKIPVLGGNTNTASIMSYGFNPYVSKASPFHGAVYAVVESLSNIAASGAPIKGAYLTLQEYFEKLRNDPVRWGKPFAAVLGALHAQLSMGVAAIGGKDSMSGSFMDIDVVPTLVSFAINTWKASKLVTSEFKKEGDAVYLVSAKYDENKLPDFEDLKTKYEAIHKLASKGKIKASSSVGFGGVAEAIATMCFGNMAGFDFDKSFPDERIFERLYGSIVIETEPETVLPDELGAVLIGRVNSWRMIRHDMDFIPLDMLLSAWETPLEEVFPTRVNENKSEIAEFIDLWNYKQVKIAPRVGAQRPKVVIPVFPGTNCEYDTAAQFEKAGAEAKIFVIKNLSAHMIEESVKELSRLIKESHILMLPGGFSGGDEPDGSGKFIATVLRNPRVSEAVMELIEARDGLVLGICNGFQALVKVGLLPYGKIMPATADMPTLTYNEIGRHQSRYVYTRVTDTKSPWLYNTKVGDVHAIPVSHGEGRFVASEELLVELKNNGQIATQYVNDAGELTYSIDFNPNGSLWAIEGITNKDGRIFGKMGHSERVGKSLALNIFGEKDQKLFKSGVDYFKI